MINDWKDYIDKNICQPLDRALNGEDPGVKVESNKLSLHGKIWFVADKNGKRELLFDMLKPYYDEYLYDPQRRMSDRYVSNTTNPDFWKSKATATVHGFITEICHANDLLRGKNVLDTVDQWVSDYYKGYDRISLHLDLLSQAAIEGWEYDWKSILEWISGELKNCPTDYDKVRMEYYCYLDAIAKISTCTEIDDAQRKEWYGQLQKEWKMIAAVYSVMIGRIIRSGHSHISTLINQFRSTWQEYAALMVAALRHHPQVLSNYKSKELAKKLEGDMRNIKQNKELYPLCGCLFPSDHWNNYDLDAPQMSTTEMLEHIRTLEEQLEHSANRENDQEKMGLIAEYLKDSLGDSISIEQLENAILSCPPSIANLIFTQLDLRLEDVSDVWTRHRKGLKQKVLALEKRDSNILNDTHAKVLGMENKPNNVYYSYGNGAIHDDHSRNIVIGETEAAAGTLFLDKF